MYAGRVPNVLKEFIGAIQGNGAKAVAVVLFGNRSFDDGLIELRALLTSGGFRVIAAGAFVGEHAFSNILAKGRPDQSDLVLVDRFARELSEKIKIGDEKTDFWVKGQMPIGNYYTPLNLQGEAVNILKVKPKTTEDCTDCKHCVEICPMESILWEDPTQVTGICIKCGACIKGCPVKAKYYDDPGFLGHKLQIETTFMEPKDSGMVPIICFLIHTHILKRTPSWPSKATDSQISYVMDVGSDLETSLRAVEHAALYPWCYAVVGYHPHEAKDMGQVELDMIAALARKPKVKAIGEIGLDFHYNHSEPDVQRDCFRKQIRLANDLRMPIVIHSREADQEVMDILKEEQAFSNTRKSWFNGQAGVLLHCYSGSKEMAEQYVKLGASISVAGPITYKNNRRTVEMVAGHRPGAFDD